jgi:hypothetical protein
METNDMFAGFDQEGDNSDQDQPMVIQPTSPLK